MTLTKANLTKVRDAKPRVLTSSATFERHDGSKIAGLPNHSNKETTMLNRTRLIRAMLFASALLFSGSLFADPSGGGATEVADVYDEGAYTEYVESTMTKLDRLYLEFCDTCRVDATRARLAKQEFLVTVRDLMQHMNGRYDAMDPKQGASLSPTETLVSIHVLTMLVDILAETQLEEMQPHPHIE